jgi:hypothetical protein
VDEIVLDHDDGLGGGKVDVGEVLQDMSVVHGGVTVRHLDVAPAFERRKHHEEIGRRCTRIRSRNGPGGPVSSGSAGASRR